MGNAYGGDEITPWLDNSLIILSDVVVSLFIVELEVLEASTDWVHCCSDWLCIYQIW